MTFYLMTITPSLRDFLLSLVAGGVIASLIVGGLFFVSQKDKIQRS
jgi:hypothetical protein